MLSKHARVTPRHDRNFFVNKFHGAELNVKENSRDMGLPVWEYLQFLMTEAGKKQVGSVLDPDKTKICSDALMDSFRRMIARVEAKAPADRKDKHRNRLHQAAKTLADQTKLDREEDAMAQVVIDIIKQSAASTVLLILDSLEQQLGHHFQSIVTEFIRRLMQLYCGTGPDIKQQLTKRFEAIGMAYTVPELQLLLAAVRYWVNMSDKALFVKDAAGNRVLRDAEAPSFTRSQIIDYVLERCSSSSQSLTSYRQAIIRIRTKHGDFAAVETRIASLLANDKLSLDHHEAFAAAHNGHAAAAHTADLDSAALIEAIANFARAGRPSSPSADSPFKRFRSDSAPGPSCHFWNGYCCHRELMTQSLCPFREHHSVGINTQTQHWNPDASSASQSSSSPMPSSATLATAIAQALKMATASPSPASAGDGGRRL